jgi:anti-sigma B factor antagonist
MEVEPPFRAELLRPAPDVVVLEVTGELDFYTSPEFKRFLAEAIETGAENLVVDLAAVSFIDSSGLGILIGGARQLGQRGRVLTIVYRAAIVARVLEVTGLDQVLAAFEVRG